MRAAQSMRTAHLLLAAALFATGVSTALARCEDPVSIGGADSGVVDGGPDSGVVDSGPELDADAGHGPDAGLCESLPFRWVYSCPVRRPFSYQHPDGCEEQTTCFQDDRCLASMLEQVCPELTVQDVADLERETVVLISWNFVDGIEVCSLVACPEGVELSTLPVDCSGPDYVELVTAILVIPKTAPDDLVLKRYGCFDRCEDGVIRDGPPYIVDICNGP